MANNGILTEEEITTLAHRKAFRYKYSIEDHPGSLYTMKSPTAKRHLAL